MKLGTMLEVDETFTNMTFKVIRGQGQGQEMTSVPYQDYFFVLLPIRPVSVGYLADHTVVTYGNCFAYIA